MNVFIYTQSYYVRNTFVNSLIPKGISLYHADHPESLIERMISQKAEILVLDVIQEDYSHIFNLIKQIRTHQSLEIKTVPIILLIGTIDKQYITLAIQIGVIGFIKSGANEDFISNYVVEIFQKVKGIPPERKFIRVQIDSTDPNERVGLKFRSPVNSQLIIGLIKDISFGGIAVELVGTFPPESLSNGLEVKNIQFILDAKDIFVDAVVVAYHDRFCAFRFTDMAPNIREAVAHYIFQRISSNNEGASRAQQKASPKTEGKPESKAEQKTEPKSDEKPAEPAEPESDKKAD